MIINKVKTGIIQAFWKWRLELKAGFSKTVGPELNETLSQTNFFKYLRSNLSVSLHFLLLNASYNKVLLCYHVAMTWRNSLITMAGRTASSHTVFRKHST